MATTNLCNANNKNVCLILLIGLPGSGKTFLTNFLVDHFRSTALKSDKACFTDLCVVPITYDDYVSYNDELDHIKDWKQKRKFVFNSVEETVRSFKDQSPGESSGRKSFCNSSQYFGNSNLLIIIDDNMYYKSMRFEYFKLAKKHETGFCQIYLDATLDIALQCNKKRVSVVPETIIERMHNRIEKPNPKINNWERNSLIIPALSDFENGSILDVVHNVIAAALLSPEQYKYVNSLSINVEDCKIITDTSLLHQIDLKFRSFINNRIKEIKLNESFNKNKIKYLAEQLNHRRLQLMKDIKSGLLTLPFDVVNILQCASKSADDDSVVHNCLLNMFVVDIDYN